MKQLHYSIQIFLQKLRQSRMYTLLILETYILYIYVQPVIKFSQDVKYPSTPWLLPFLFSNIYFIFLFMLGVVSVSYTHLDVYKRQHSKPFFNLFTIPYKENKKMSGCICHIRD